MPFATVAGESPEGRRVQLKPSRAWILAVREWARGGGLAWSERVLAPLGKTGRLKRIQSEMESKFVFLREVNSLCNPRFGIDHTVSATMEKLRVYYEADCCLLVSSGANGEGTVLRQASSLNPESTARKTALAPELTQHFLSLPATVGFTRDAPVIRELSKAGHTPPMRGYDVVSHQKVALENDLSPFLTEFLEGHLIGVPLLHQEQKFGRLFLTSRQRSFDQNDIEFIHQVVSSLVPILKNMELVEHFALDAASEERERIARDIHDSIVQPHIGLQMGIEALRQKVIHTESHLGSEILADIERLSELCHAGTLELRSYVHQLKNSRQGEEHLLGAIRRLTLPFEATTGIQVRLEAESAMPLPPRLCAEILQMVAEGLSNIRRHTRAETAILRLSCRQSFFILDIENRNGASNSCFHSAHPFSPDSQRHTFTPVSLAERAWALGGCIAVESQAQGATVTLKIPL